MQFSEVCRHAWRMRELKWAIEGLNFYKPDGWANLWLAGGSVTELETDIREWSNKWSKAPKPFADLSRPMRSLKPSPLTANASSTRELAAAYPDRYWPDLAAALTNLGSWFAVLGYSDQTIPLVQETVDAWRELAAVHPRSAPARFGSCAKGFHFYTGRAWAHS